MVKTQTTFQSEPLLAMRAGLSFVLAFSDGTRRSCAGQLWLPAPEYGGGCSLKLEKAQCGS
jgi:hypothetical protein